MTTTLSNSAGPSPYPLVIGVVGRHMWNAATIDVQRAWTDLAFTRPGRVRSGLTELVKAGGELGDLVSDAAFRDRMNGDDNQAERAIAVSAEAAAMDEGRQ